jgi:hypothetical protein
VGGNDAERVEDGTPTSSQTRESNVTISAPTDHDDDEEEDSGFSDKRLLWTESEDPFWLTLGFVLSPEFEL